MSGTLGSVQGGVDSSIPLQAGRGVQQPNPLSTIGDFARTAGAINELQLFPGKQQLQQQAIQTGASSLAQQQLRAAAGALIPLLAKKDGTITLNDVGTALGSAEANMGIVTQPFLAHLQATAPDPTSATAFDPYMRATIASLSQPNTALAVGQVTKGQGPTYDEGSALIPTTVNPAGLGNAGIVTPVPSAGMPTGLTPAQRAGQVSTVATQEDVDRDPSLRLNQPISLPLEEVVRRQGAGGLVTPGANPMNPPGLPPSLRNPNRQVPLQETPGNQQQGGPISVPGGKGAPVPGQVIAPPAALPAAKSPGGVPTAAPPGYGQEVETAEQQYRAATGYDTNYKSVITPLQQAERFLKSAKTGPGTDTANLIQSYITTWAPGMAKQLGIDPTKVADFDSAVKFLAQTALGSPGALTSDMRTQLSQVANASTHIQPAAAQHVVQLSIALENMKHAAVSQFDQQYGTSPGVATNWPAFMRDFQRQYDPRGFYWDAQSRQQKQSEYDSASKADRERISNSIALARQMGISGAQ